MVEMKNVGFSTFYSENQKERGHLGDAGVDGRILQLVLKK
jgi:hypothetical protein